MTQNRTLYLSVHSIRHEALGIKSFDLRCADGMALPRFKAGAHIDLHLPNDMIRSYSLHNSEEESHRYGFAVSRDPSSRGGSLYLHEAVKEGDVLCVTEPRNNFSLREDAKHSIFIAGGVGITPIWCMIQTLEKLGRSWELYYGVRTRSRAAFLDQIQTLRPQIESKVHFSFDDEPGGKLLDMTAIATKAPPDAHLYCCGPLPMLPAFEEACVARPPDTVHVEYFKALEAPSPRGGFEVHLARSSRSVFVPEGKSILDALLDEGVDIVYSCMEGVCGECATRVLDGLPDHRDVVLTREQRESNTLMMICSSGCFGDSLTLDL